MPALPKRKRLLEEVAAQHARRKRARLRFKMAEFLDDLPSSDPEHATDSSSSSLSSISSPSSLSSSSSDHSDSASSSRSTTSFDDFDFDMLEHRLMDLWDARVQALATYLLTTRVLELSPPVKKLGQLTLYQNDFRHDHPDWFQKKLRVLPPVFDRLVDLIEGHHVFQNNSHVPQYPVPVQLAILLVRLGHYGNASSPEYVCYASVHAHQSYLIVTTPRAYQFIAYLTIFPFHPTHVSTARPIPDSFLTRILSPTPEYFHYT
jgi:hypothetical protein